MNKKADKENLFLNILLNVIIPSVVLVKLSKEEYLGPVYSLIIALLFPISYGIYDLIKRRKFNFFSILGLISVLLTGGIGLLELDKKWVAIKEASIPFIIGLIVLGSIKTKYPLIKTLIYNEQIINLILVEKTLKIRGTTNEFAKTLRNSSYFLAMTFLLSAILNYIVAKVMIVHDPSIDKVAFNQEIGAMTFWSYFIIAIPTMICFMAIFFYIFYSLKKLTKLSIDNIFANIK